MIDDKHNEINIRSIDTSLDWSSIGNAWFDFHLEISKKCQTMRESI